VSTLYYENLALGWKPESKSDRTFKLITAIVIVAMLIAGLVLSTIDVPKEKRETRTAIPPRIAKFIIEREKVKPKPKPVPPKPKPKPKPKPIVEQHVQKQQTKQLVQQKPLTKVQKQARKTAEKSGLLALSNELSGLMDTSAVAQQVGGSVNTSTGAAKAATQNEAILTDTVSKGSGGVNTQKYASNVPVTKLGHRDIQQVNQSLIASTAKGSSSGGNGKSRTGNVRSEEDVTITFDQNKSILYSIYNRERRRNPGLKGKIVLEITISASGKVTAVKVVSSELNSPRLEQRLISRIKTFNFGAQKVKSLTVTYPIEFLPS